MIKIKITGKEGKNWSVDDDRFYTEKALSELNCKLTNTFLNADIIFSVWYSYLLRSKMLFLRLFKNKKKIIAVITNNIEKSNVNFLKYKTLVDYWIYSNSEQKRFLLKKNIEEKVIFYNPYYVDETIFKNSESEKKEIAEQLNIDFALIKNRFLIGSFQRDSLGTNLSKPKWQKNPELIINILKNIDKTKFVLILAGPRRHWLINQCRNHNIPYIFVGNEHFINEKKDDISDNNLSKQKISLLYNLIDLYIITSISEGGPKAVLEASLTKTPVLSTSVGLAPDFLSTDSLCKNENEFYEKINHFINFPKSAEMSVSVNYKNVSKINNFESYKFRLKNIIETVAND